MTEPEKPNDGQVILYRTPDGAVRVDVRTVNEHLQNIYKSGELPESSTIRKFRIVQREGKRDVAREIDFYNLDATISVGYRVNSAQATQFRIWATRTLPQPFCEAIPRATPRHSAKIGYMSRRIA